MSDTPSDAPAAKTKKPVMPPSRIAVIVFAIVAAVIVFFELRARYAWDDTYKAVVAKKESKEGAFKKDVEGLIQGNPTIEEFSERDMVLYTWSGVLKKYLMRVTYGPEGFLVTIDQE